MIKPDGCQTMAEDRGLDTQIVALLGERFRFMEAAGMIKLHRGDVRDEARKAAVIDRAERLALAAGVPPGITASLYETLVDASISYELGRFDEKWNVGEAAP